MIVKEKHYQQGIIGIIRVITGTISISIQHGLQPHTYTFLYEFKLDHNPAETARNIRITFGDDTVNELTVQRRVEEFDVAM